MAKKYWVVWNYKSSADEITELLIDEINDMIKDNNIKINYEYSEDDAWDYRLNLTKEDSNEKSKKRKKEKQHETVNQY
jgi:hypothetical protein